MIGGERIPGRNWRDPVAAAGLGGRAGMSEGILFLLFYLTHCANSDTPSKLLGWSPVFERINQIVGASRDA